MTKILAHVTLPYVTNIPADVTVNTFAVDNPADIADPVEITDALIGFYNDVPASTHSVAEHIGEGISRAANACTIELYDVDVLPSGPPLYTRQWTLAATSDAYGTHDLPSEVAATLTIHGDLDGITEFGAGGTRPRSRRRGRIYIGPLKVGVLFEDPANFPVRVSPQMRSTLASAGVSLLAELGTYGAAWSVWSRVDGVFYPVEGGWVDDAFDIQRRRGVSPSVRTLW